ncbi:MAG: hypothetical protein U0746_05775 [Gemmataceae bacterium]
MRRLLYLLPAGLLVFGVVAWLYRGAVVVPPVHDGDQEVAWIHAATSGSTWERFVTGIHRAAHDDSRLHVNDSHAFLDQTTSIPEVVVSADGVSGKLRIRWYKLTSETNSNYWVRQLAARDPAPLAFIGGGTSDRALDLARALAGQAEWHGERPLLLILTATANAIHFDPLNGESDRLIDVYKGRSFRGCFTNEQMADAVVDFLWSQPDLRPTGSPLRALASVASASEPWTGLLALASTAADPPPAVTALEWNDDPYSIDLSRQFHKAFHAPHRPAVRGETRGIYYSVGGIYRPNRWETEAADILLRDLLRPGAEFERQVLVLPASPVQGRRVLRSVVGSVPLAGRNLVAVTGDSVGFNHLYRDGDFAWNVRSVPVPLIAFAHQNPVAWDSERANGEPHPANTVARDAASSHLEADAPRSPLRPPSGTDDVLLHRDLVRLLTDAAFPAQGSILDSADAVANRLRDHDPPFFDAAGDRLVGHGEHVVVVRPQFLDPGTPMLVTAHLEVWARSTDGWKFLERLTIDHGRTNRNP